MKKTNPSQPNSPSNIGGIGIYDGANCKNLDAITFGQAFARSNGVDIFGSKTSGEPEKTMIVTAGLSEKRITKVLKNLTGNGDLHAHQNLKIVNSNAFSGPQAIDLSSNEGRNSFDQRIDPDCVNVFLYDYKSFNGKSQDKLSELSSDQYLKTILAWAEGHKLAGRTVILLDRSFSLLDHVDWEHAVPHNSF